MALTGMLAGCGGGDGGDGGDGGSGDVPSEVSDYLDGAMNYDGSVADQTGSSSVEVEVGAGDTGLAFGPAAVRVDAGTQVTWVWTGAGGTHNVVSEDDTFRSGDPVSQEGNEFQYTFDESGVYTYYCNPHKASGMKGAVVVE